MSSASIHKLFCGVYLVFKCSFDEFMGEKVFSLSYSSAILAPPPNSFFLNQTHIQRKFRELLTTNPHFNGLHTKMIFQGFWMTASTLPKLYIYFTFLILLISKFMSRPYSSLLFSSYLEVNRQQSIHSKWIIIRNICEWISNDFPPLLQPINDLEPL